MVNTIQKLNTASGAGQPKPFKKKTAATRTREAQQGLLGVWIMETLI
ncbi:MAG: hypothetical protein LBM19_02575 [Holosporales bacterium]|nr:hypothetical protein [Holosporales bacterium]